MFKRTLVFSLAVALMLVGLCTVASAASNNVANTSQKGSVLVFPKIDVSALDFDSGALGQAITNRETIVTIGNDYTSAVWVQCYWVNAAQEHQDFMFRVTANQPIWFRASDGLGTGSFEPLDRVTSPITAPPFFSNTVGELICWAVDAADQNQINFNYLYGSATIFDPVDAAAFTYNAWAFTARTGQTNQKVGTGGEIDFDGTNNYDACPQYLNFNFWAEGAVLDRGYDYGNITFERTDLTLVPCYQDLRQERGPTCAKVTFDIWNENETKYTGAYQCFKCWFEGYLGDIGDPSAEPRLPKGFGGDKFIYENLHTTLGRFRVTPSNPSSVCDTAFKQCPKGSQTKTAVLGIISTEIKLGLLGDGQVPAPTTTLVGTNASTAGSFTNASEPKYPQKILWDTGGDNPESPGR